MAQGRRAGQRSWWRGIIVHKLKRLLEMAGIHLDLECALSDIVSFPDHTPRTSNNRSRLLDLLDLGLQVDVSSKDRLANGERPDMKGLDVENSWNIADRFFDFFGIDPARRTLHEDGNGSLKDADSGENDQERKDEGTDGVQVGHRWVEGDDE